MVPPALVLLLISVASATAVRRATPQAPAVAGATNFVAAGASASARAGTAPALQPSEVYDVDYPVDMAKLTPEELRYRAQADYARAIAALKREAAEAEAAKKAMEAELQDLLRAKERARKAAEEALRAKGDVDRLRAEAAAADAKAGTEAGEAGEAKGLTDKQKADYETAMKAFKDAEAAEAAMRVKIADLDKRHKELCAESLKLEKERAATLGESGAADAKIAAEASGVSKAKQELDASEAAASKEAAEAAKAAKDAEAAKAKLAAAEAAAKAGAGKDAEQAKAVQQAKATLDAANQKLSKENADVTAAKKRMADAKAELGKYQEKHSSSSRASATLALVFMAVAALGHP